MFRFLFQAFFRDFYPCVRPFLGIPTSYAQPEADRSWGSGLRLHLTALIAIKNVIFPKDCKIAAK